MIFVEPGSVKMEAVAGEGDHGVVGQDDQDEEDQRYQHRPEWKQNTLCAQV